MTRRPKGKRVQELEAAVQESDVSPGPAAEDGANSQYLVNAVSRAAHVIEVFRDEESLSLSDIATKLATPKATVFRTVVTLEHVGLLERRPDGRYALGPLFISSARLVLRRSLAVKARPFLDVLFRATGHSVNLGILNRDEVLYVDSIDSRDGLRMVSVIGDREPLHATAVGKAMLAELEPSQLDTVIGTAPLRALTPNTITSRTKLQAELELTRDRGYAVDEGECVAGARCVGAAIRDVHKVIGGVSVSASAANLPKEELQRVGQMVNEVAARITDVSGIEPVPDVGGER